MKQQGLGDVSRGHWAFSMGTDEKVGAPRPLPGKKKRVQLSKIKGLKKLKKPKRK